jgi:hypothetical protein
MAASTDLFAGDKSLYKALRLLSDGSFKLFVYLLLNADRQTGCVQTGFNDLASKLNRSNQHIADSIDELRRKGVCSVYPADDSFSPMLVSICSQYWPHEREPDNRSESEKYVAVVREKFLALECTSGTFGRNDIRIAKCFCDHGIPLETVQDALLTGACRKIASCLDGRMLEPIGSLAYFEKIVTEIQSHPLPPGYRDYLSMQLEKLALIFRQQSWQKQAVHKITSKDDDDVVNPF